MTLDDLLPDILGRLEENVEGGPVFWSQTYEILPSLVDAMFEASLITGVTQAINVPVMLPAFTTYIGLQQNDQTAYSGGYGSGGYGSGGYGAVGWTDLGIPQGVIAALRLRLPWPIRKVSLKGLSDMQPGWQNAAPSDTVRAWFPLGVSSFGIYPQLTDPATAIMDFIVAPTTAARPYTTGMTVPFQEEFTDAFGMYAAVMCRAKELGQDAEEASTVMNEYMEQMKALGMFQNRLDSLVLTNAYGAKATVNRRELV